MQDRTARRQRPARGRAKSSGDPWATLRGFFAERAPWLRLDVHQNAWGTWDITLRIDGSYATEELALGVLPLFRRELARLARRERLELEDWHEPDPPKDEARW